MTSPSSMDDLSSLHDEPHSTNAEAPDNLSKNDTDGQATNLSEKPTQTDAKSSRRGSRFGWLLWMILSLGAIWFSLMVVDEACNRHYCNDLMDIVSDHTLMLQLKQQEASLWMNEHVNPWVQDKYQQWNDWVQHHRDQLKTAVIEWAEPKVCQPPVTETTTATVTQSTTLHRTATVEKTVYQTSTLRETDTITSTAHHTDTITNFATVTDTKTVTDTTTSVNYATIHHTTTVTDTVALPSTITVTDTDTTTITATVTSTETLKETLTETITDTVTEHAIKTITKTMTPDAEPTD
ncbi:predicted protein [Lichtheimia corymbifera JMRC:FSU:9682]|uniref:Uncharacterized protein n=1 Tax=Lichtheimia corymbifera JMRC:FSU:9682 TaxID=1263082 RepID=A0A068S0Z4_9FUNG|nr:predicted protein [Lichtheimia corymbifera JMRC:FSU:9682]